MRDPNCIRRRLLRIAGQCYSPGSADPSSRWSVVGTGTKNPLPCQSGQDSALVGVVDLDDGTDAIVVACRGTLFSFGSEEERAATTLDWLNNDDCRPTPFEQHRPALGNLHGGFQRAVNTIWTPLSDRVAVLLAERPQRTIYVTGHSKGGAMACIVALKLKRLHERASIRVITFAAARPGDAQFAAAYDAAGIPTTRYECWPDPVPELPPGTRGSGLLRRFVAPLFRLPRLRNLGIANLPPYEPVGTRAPAGSWAMDAFRNLFGGIIISPRKFLLAHAIDPGTRYDDLVCSKDGADRCDHR